MSSCLREAVRVPPPVAIASRAGQRVYELIPWMKGLVFPLPFPDRDAQPATSEQSGQERALSCCEGTPGALCGAGGAVPCFPAAGKVEDFQPGPFLPTAVSRRCFWDLLPRKGKSQLGFLSWGERIRAGRDAGDAGRGDASLGHQTGAAWGGWAGICPAGWIGGGQCPGRQWSNSLHYFVWT